MPIPTSTGQQIQRELGDQDANVLTSYLSNLWDSRADKNYVIAGLQYLYTKRDACDVLIGNVWSQVQIKTADQDTRLDQKMKNLQTIRTNINEEISRLERRSRANRAPVVGQITAVTPVTATGPIISAATQPFADPNDPAYRGDPQRQSLQDIPF